MKYKLIPKFPADELPEGGGTAVEEAPVDSIEPAAPVKANDMPRQPLDAKDIARTVAETMTQFQKQNTPEVKQDPKAVMEQLRKDTKYYKASKEDLKDLFSVDSTEDQREAAFGRIQDRMYEHQAALLDRVTNDRIGGASSKFQPVMDYFMQQQVEAKRNGFYADYPGLKPYEEVVALVAGQMPQVNPKTGKPFTDEEAVTNLISVVTSQLKKLGKEVDPKKSISANPNTESEDEAPTGVPRSPALRGSGRSPSDASPPKKFKSPNESIWED